MRRVTIWLSLLAVCALARAAPAAAQSPGDAGASASAPTRYTLANGCWALRSRSAGRFVAKSGDSYTASASSVGGGEPLRLQATALGRYLFYGRARDFMAGSGDSVESADRPSESADWRVAEAGAGAFRITLPALGKVLAVNGGGALGLRDASSSGNSTLFTFERASGCPRYPEVEVNAVGKPLTAKIPYSEVRGYVDAHMHMMAFEFLGGRAHCGRPWHRYGAPYALVDCPDHTGQGCAAVLENVLYKEPVRCHDPVGWPTFRDWPDPDSLTHEQSYYKWLERSWRAGQRVFVNLLVENAELCELYPLKKNSCDEMDSVRLQRKRIGELQDYIDAQNGGPGKGWFRIVTNPFQARRVIAQGKLAVVLGIEVSEPFGCRIYNDQPQCTPQQIDRELKEVYDFGVRDMELINKFDNALAGVAGDAGETGVVVNTGNRHRTGKYWEMAPCDGPADEADKEQPGVYDHDHNDLISNGLEAFVPKGFAPIYPRGAQCNTRGLTMLGERVVRRMMERGMMVDPDHLGVLARKQVMALLETEKYSGAVSSHSWSSPDVIPRIYNLGGFISPYAGDSTSFVRQWREFRKQRNHNWYFGFGYGADMNGFGSQGHARGGKNPVKYPFKSFDGGVTLHRQRSGVRVYDINRDGVAHYGLYPDWIEDLRKIAGNQIVEELARGAEAYLQMWERAEGIKRERCRAKFLRVTPKGVGRVRLNDTHGGLLRHAGQPARREGRVWSYCVKLRTNRFAAVFTPGAKVGLVGTSARGNRIRGIGPGGRVRKIKGRPRPFGRGVLIRRSGKTTLVYGVRKGRVRYVAIANRSAGKSRKRLRSYLKLAKLI